MQIWPNAESITIVDSHHVAVVEERLVAVIIDAGEVEVCWIAADRTKQRCGLLVLVNSGLRLTVDGEVDLSWRAGHAGVLSPKADHYDLDRSRVLHQRIIGTRLHRHVVSSTMQSCASTLSGWPVFYGSSMTTESRQPAESPPVEVLDVSQLATLLRERRGRLSLRQAAREAGVSFSTFSRVEAGSQPDLTSFTLLCAWLGMPPSQFFAPAPAREVESIDLVIGHLRSDPRLRPDAAQKITDMLRSMYQALATETIERPVVACHLRAASTLRPGVPERLNTLLNSMRERLEQKVAANEL